MGKVGPDEGQPAHAAGGDALEEENEEGRGSGRYRFGCGCGGGFNAVSKRVGLRCVTVLLLSAGVFLSAVFWLPPFLHLSDQEDPDLDYRFRDHDIIASFMVNKPISLIKDNILQLEDNISDEISVRGTKVVILSLDPSSVSNVTKVVFGVDPEDTDSKLSSTAQSLVSDSFEYLVVNQSLQLTMSLFGVPSSFEVLKFPGGITIIPLQRAFLLQKVQIHFNFTLNFPIDQIQANFAELTSQLRTGIHLAPYENLYIILSNSKGSTVAPPTTVQSSVLLAFGAPLTQRLKQLAQEITGHSRNLGLNNTVFGKVKQVRLSSILQHSLHGGEGGSPSPSPSPSPLPQPHHHHHHHHQHHHHHHHNDKLAPTISPAPTERGGPTIWRGAPVPQPHKSSPAPRSNEAKPPDCRLGHKWRSVRNGGKYHHLAPTIPPNVAPHSAASPGPYSGTISASPTTAPSSPTVPASSPLPNVVFAHVQPPSKTESDEGHSDDAPSVSPSPSSSSAGVPTVQWAFLLSLGLILLSCTNGGMFYS